MSDFMSNWTRAEDQMPELLYPSCQACYRDPTAPIDRDVMLRFPEICRHETNVHYSLPFEVLVGRPGEWPQVFHRVVDYRGVMAGSGEVVWSRSWSSSSCSMDIKGTLWTPLERVPSVD